MKVKEEALKQYRITRDKLEMDHPGLLSSIRDQILNASAKRDSQEVSYYAVDSKKNLETAIKFLEISSESPLIQAELKKMLLKKIN